MEIQKEGERGRAGRFRGWDRVRERRDVLQQIRDKLYKEERVIRGISRIFHSKEKKISSSVQTNAVSYSS